MNDIIIIEKAEPIKVNKKVQDDITMLAAYNLILGLFEIGEITESELRAIQKDCGIQ